MASLIGAGTTYKSVPERWHAIVEQNATRPALTIDDRTLTYAELHDYVDRIAYALMTHFPDPGHPVGFMFGVGWQPVAAMFGILKAGHIYVPMDIQIPTQRLQRITDHAGIEIVLVDDETAALGILPDRVQTINVDTLDPVDTVSGSDYSDGAYLIYTSGSTGEPKGVLHNHANILKYTDLDTTLFDLNTETRGAHFFHYGFAATRTMTFDILLNGGHLHLYDVRRSGYPALGPWIKRHALDIVHLTPTVAREMTKEISARLALPHLSTILFTSEPLRRNDVEQLRAKLDTRSVIVNRLASSEAGAVAEYWIQPDTILDHSLVPIGYPLKDFNHLAILDEQGKSVPEGQCGELVIAGKYIFIGYWDKNTRSGGGIEQHPDHPDQRIFHSGDLAEVQPGGRLQYLGRSDSILKIRGIRVDIGDVEEMILTHPAVVDVAVVVPNDTADSLAAFYTLSQLLSSQELRQYLTERLQQHMIPTWLLDIPAIPLTATGKVDLQALKRDITEHQARRSQATPVIETPASELERLIARIWQDALDIRHIGPHDNFFDLGGNSIDAARIMDRLQKESGFNVPLSFLITHGTIAELARIMQDNTILQSGWSTLVPLKERGSRYPLFIVHGVGGNVLDLPQLAAHLDAEQPAFGIQSVGLDGDAEPFNDVEQMAAFYISAIRAHQPYGPYYLAGYSFGGVVAFEMARQLAAQRQSIGALILFDTAAVSDQEGFYEGRVRDGLFSRQTKRTFRRLIFSPHILFRMSSQRRRRFLARKRLQFWQLTQWIKNDFTYPIAPERERRVRAAHFVALDRYTIRPFPGNASFIYATMALVGNPRTEQNRVEWWSRHIQGQITMFPLEGTHMDIVHSPEHLAQVVKFVSEVLEEAQHPAGYALHITQTS